LRDIKESQKLQHPNNVWGGEKREEKRKNIRVKIIKEIVKFPQLRSSVNNIYKFIYCNLFIDFFISHNQLIEKSLKA
jgi:hypothetical protein